MVIWVAFGLRISDSLRCLLMVCYMLRNIATSFIQQLEFNLRTVDFIVLGRVRVDFLIPFFYRFSSSWTRLNFLSITHSQILVFFSSI